MEIGAAPHPEEPTFSATLGHVKHNHLNNEYYIDQLKGDIRYPIVLELNQKLSIRFPGYNISQIEDEYGLLRFHVTQGACPDGAWNASEARHMLAETECLILKLPRHL